MSSLHPAVPRSAAVCEHPRDCHTQRRASPPTPPPCHTRSCTNFDWAVNAAISYGTQIGTTGDIQFFALPLGGACDWGGMGSMPGTNSWYPSWDYTTNSYLVAHEAGHNLGLHHSTYNGDEYGDISSAMATPFRLGLCYAWPQQAYLGCEWVGGCVGGWGKAERHPQARARAHPAARSLHHPTNPGPALA